MHQRCIAFDRIDWLLLCRSNPTVFTVGHEGIHLDVTYRLKSGHAE